MTAFELKSKTDKAVSQVGSGGFWYLGSSFSVGRSQLLSSTISFAVWKFLASIIPTSIKLNVEIEYINRIKIIIKK